MASVGLIQFASAAGMKSITGLAKTAGVGPPPPPISVRALIRLLGLPLEPTQLGLFWDNNAAGEIIYRPADDQSVPLKNVQFTWSDPGAPVRKATIWQIAIQDESTGQSFASTVVTTLGGFGDSGFKADTAYSWSVVPSNGFGQGPSSPVFTFRTAPVPVPPPKPPSITVGYTGPPASAQFDIKGTGFTPSHAVRIRGVNDANINSAFGDTNSDASGAMELKVTISCPSGTQLSFSATDGRPDGNDVTGTLWSNTVSITAS